MIDLTGRTLGNYRIDKLLGKGGMGAVYRGHDVELDRPVAVKVMLPTLMQNREFLQRFQQEARAAARLDHPGIVKVYARNTEEDYSYIVMEFIEGDNLKQRLDKLRHASEWLSLGESVQLVTKVAQALDYAHQQGILHRDIKPANIMIRAGNKGEQVQPVITDLGLAKIRQGGMVTQTTASMGTPDYMSPEQAMDNQIDARTDIYSLGVVLYELAVGQRPYSFSSISKVTAYFSDQRRSPLQLPSSIRTDLPAPLEAVILRALEVDLQSRFQSAGAMAEALSTIPLDSLPSAPPPNLNRVAADLGTQIAKSIQEQRNETSLWGKADTPGQNEFDILQIRDPHGETRNYPIQKQMITIGRDSQSDIVLHDDRVSRRHVQITFDNSEYVVADLDSRNGSHLDQNFLKNESSEWLTGQTLRVGGHYLRLLRKKSQASSATSRQTQTYRSVTTVAQPKDEELDSALVTIQTEPAALSWKKASFWGGGALLTLLLLFFASIGIGLLPRTALPGLLPILVTPTATVVPPTSTLVPARVTPQAVVVVNDTPTSSETPTPTSRAATETAVALAAASATNAAATETLIAVQSANAGTQTAEAIIVLTRNAQNTATAAEQARQTQEAISATETFEALPTNTNTDTPTPAPFLIVTVSNANIRSGPGNYERVGSAKQNDRFLVTGKSSTVNWWRIDFIEQNGNHREGWISGDIVSVTNAENTALVDSPGFVPFPTDTFTPTDTPTPTNTPTPTDTPFPVCTPPPCPAEGTLICEISSCPGGCGMVCKPPIMPVITVHPPGGIDIYADAPLAHWSSGSGDLPFGGSDGDSRGFVLYREGSLVLEDGTAPFVLETHPQWVDNGYIRGEFFVPFINSGQRFTSQLAFIMPSGSPGTNGVLITVRVNRTIVYRGIKEYTGNRVTIDVDLSEFAGDSATLELEVSANGSSGQDWLCWINPRIQ